MAKPGSNRTKRSKTSKETTPATRVYPDPSVVVIGDGWSAMGAVGYLAAAGIQVCWVAGTGARALAPLPSLESGPGAYVWAQLAERLKVSTGPLMKGTFLREFRNKSFRTPTWAKAPTPQDRVDTRDEVLWIPETRFAAAFESRFELPLADLEDQLRKTLTGDDAPVEESSDALETPVHQFVERIGAVPVQAVDLTDGATSVTLASGRKIPCERIIFADRWNTLPTIEGLPKGLPFMRGRQPQGLLQAVFTHSSPMVTSEVREGFYGATNKEAGEDIQRSVFGYFFNEGRCSVWTLFLASDEVEDNHLIAKKLRRMKQALDRMFTGTEWIPEGKTDFISTVSEEQVRFEASFVFGSGQTPTDPIHLGKNSRISFLTDGYGPAKSLHQVGLLLGSELKIELEPSEEKEEAQFLSGTAGDSSESEDTPENSSSSEAAANEADEDTSRE